ncbi:MAG: hypothetical protein QNJ87_14635 [Gammaproteobacteria bacterium]|nr:hypothetical protein [Gammaproteobacteria bacterium]MDJ0872988.1 hypothetical protein [Gammaproteobacteria bacterium]MDJ0891077.1 hypothetical protein [Gammaproteobacteria bacterium]
MNKQRTLVWNDDGLRLQEVVPEPEVRVPQPTVQWPLGTHETREDDDEDTVVALTWPQESGWRHH